MNVEGHTPNHVLQILQEAEHTITFKLVPSTGRPLLRCAMSTVLHIADQGLQGEPGAAEGSV